MLTLLKGELYKIFTQKLIYIMLVLICTIFILFQFQSSYDLKDVDLNYIFKDIKGDIDEEFIENYQKFDTEKALLEAGEFNEEELEELEKKTNENGKNKVSSLVSKDVIDYIETFNDVNLRGNYMLNNYIYQYVLSFIDIKIERYNNYLEYYNKLETNYNDKDLDVESDYYLDIRKEFEMYKKVDEPTIKYLGNANSVIDFNFTYGSIMLAILVVIGLAGIFSNDYSTGVVATVLTTKRGRNKIFLIKLIASFIFIIVMWLVTNLFGFYTLSIRNGFNMNNSTIIDLYKFLYSPFDWTIYKYYSYQLLFSLIGALSLGMITICISSKTRSGILALIASGSVFLVPLVLSKKMVTSITGVFNHYYTMSLEPFISTYNSFNIFGKPVLMLYINIFVTVFVGVISIFICKKFYTSWQVKEN